jgi:Transposase domain (DUF772)
MPRKGNVYLKLGDQIEQILDGIAITQAPSKDPRKAQANLSYALMTVFQYLEGLTDQQTLDAVCSRVDLKYALHLPLVYSSFNPNALCEFRQQVSQEADLRRAFEKLLDRLASFGFLRDELGCDAPLAQIVDALCTANRFEIVVDAMYETLEVVAATHADWLRKIARPYWYVRYNCRSRLALAPRPLANWQSITAEIAGDIQYFLEQIDQSDLPALAGLPEVRELKRVWSDQFILGNHQNYHQPITVWRPTRCASCRRQELAREEGLSKE